MASTHFFVDERVDFLQRTAIHVRRERFELSRQQGAILDGRLGARMKAVFADQLDVTVLVLNLRLFGVRDHLMFGA